MDFKKIQSLKDIKQFVLSIENQDCGIRTPFFTTEKYSYLKLNTRIIEFPKSPVDTIFNRIIISDPSSTEYFSVSLEPQRKLSLKQFRERSKIKENWFSLNGSLSENDFCLNENFNYDSNFFQIANPLEFLSGWLKSIFSEEIIQQFLKGMELPERLNRYQNNFKENEKETWKNTSEVIRIFEDRNDMRIIVMINPYDLHPELVFSSLENIGIVSPVMSLFYSWFSYSNLIRLEKKISFSLSETVQYEKFPDVLNNEQVFEINTTPIKIDGIDMTEVVIKGAKNQVKLYKDYFNQLLDIYPLDVLSKGDFHGEEMVAVDMYGKKIKYYHGSRLYIKPEFDLMILFYPEIVKDDNGMEYIEFHLNMRYRPFIKFREKDVKWTWHHLLEDLYK